MFNLRKKNKGMAAIVAVVIVGAVALIITKSLGLMGIDELDSISAYSGGEKARAVAESCVEEGLRRLQLDNSYLAANKSLNIGDGSCVLTVSGVGSNRHLSAAARYDNYYRYYEADAKIKDNRLERPSYREIINY